MIERWIREAIDELAREDVKEIIRANKRAQECGCERCRQQARATEDRIYGWWDEREFRKTGMVYKKKKHH